MHRKYGKNPPSIHKTELAVSSGFKMSALPLARNISCFQPSKISTIRNQKSHLTSYILHLKPFRKVPEFLCFPKIIDMPNNRPSKIFSVGSLHLCHTPPVALLHCRELLLMFICLFNLPEGSLIMVQSKYEIR